MAIITWRPLRCSQTANMRRARLSACWERKQTSCQHVSRSQEWAASLPTPFHLPVDSEPSIIWTCRSLRRQMTTTARWSCLQSLPLHCKRPRIWPPVIQTIIWRSRPPHMLKSTTIDRSGRSAKGAQEAEWNSKRKAKAIWRMMSSCSDMMKAVFMTLYRWKEHIMIVWSISSRCGTVMTTTSSPSLLPNHTSSWVRRSRGCVKWWMGLQTMRAKSSINQMTSSRCFCSPSHTIEESQTKPRSMLGLEVAWKLI